MTIRFAQVALFALCCGQTLLTAGTSYTFGTTDEITFSSLTASPTYTRGDWTEDPNNSNQQIVCVVALADTDHICGSPSTARQKTSRF